MSGVERPPAIDLSTLNPSQRDAVCTTEGPLLVLAGAGTGKTRVITYRMAELIRCGCRPDRILSVTFTNKAAREMQERTLALLPGRGRIKPHVSTFHALCVGILRQDIEALGYPRKFVIYDRGDQESTARKALREIRVLDAALRPGDLLSRISNWKMKGLSPGDAACDVEDDLDLLAVTGYRRYQSLMHASAALDFDDLILMTLRLFDEFPEIREKHQSRFDYVQIDEYQDTNGTQFRLIEALVEQHQNLCVVGDDDQSIYGWRGADVRHILGFQHHFPKAKVVRLQDNYRCTAEIIQLANRVVKNNRDRHDKQLVAHKSREQCITFREFPDELTEAEGIVRELNYLITSGNAKPNELAILFRTNEQPRVFESELRRLRVPYRLTGGQSFFDRKEVKDIVAYLKVIANPVDEVSLLRIINTPARNIGEASVGKLMTRAVQSGSTFWDVVDSALAVKEITPKTRTAIVEFHSLLDAYRGHFERPGVNFGEVLHSLLSKIDYESEIDRQYKDAGQKLQRSSIIEDMVNAITEYQHRSSHPALTGFLDELALATSDDRFEKEEENPIPSVHLMTLHSAKGLEFERVYLVGMEEGILPHQRSLEIDPTDVQEERRLCYVGVTRAREYLTLSRAATRLKWGRRKDSLPSRFLTEMTDSKNENPKPPDQDH